MLGLLVVTVPGLPAMTGELLRRAADRVVQAAAEATRGPWRVECRFDSDVPQAVFVEVDEDDTELLDVHDGTAAIGGFDRPADNAWAALFGPQNAGPLAAWLRSAAEDAEQIGPDRHAVAFARAILGEQP